MRNFNRDSRPGGNDRGGDRFGGAKRSFGGGGGFGGPRPSSDRPQLFTATCSDCGNSCEVPFRPTGDRPVFCNDCFRKQKSGGAPAFGGNRGGDKFAARPRFEKSAAPVAVGGANLGQFKDQLDAISSKLDRILRALPAQLNVEEAVVAKKEVKILAPVEKAQAKLKVKAKKVVAKKKK